MHAPPFGHVDVTGQTRYTFPKYQENGAATVRNLTILTSVVMLSACSSNPLAGLTRLSDVNVAENAVEVAVAEAVDVQPVAAQAPTPVETAAIEAVTPEISSPADITDPAQKPGFFSRMLGGITSGATKSVQDSADPAAQDTPDPAAQDTASACTTNCAGRGARYTRPRTCCCRSHICCGRDTCAPARRIFWPYVWRWPW